MKLMAELIQHMHIHKGHLILLFFLINYEGSSILVGVDSLFLFLFTWVALIRTGEAGGKPRSKRITGCI